MNTPHIQIDRFKIEACGACHNDCLDCAHGELRKATINYQLSIEQVKSFIHYTEKSNYTIKRLQIHGAGEPLLWQSLNEALTLFRQSNAIERIELYTNGKELHRIEDRSWDCIDYMNISVYEPNQKLVLKKSLRHHSHKIEALQKNSFFPRIRSKNNVYAVPCQCESDGPMLLGDIVFPYCGPPLFDVAALLELDLWKNIPGINLKKTIAIKPTFAEAHYNLGNALRKQGKLDKAVTSYQKAIAIKPNYAEAHSNFGNTLQAQGKLDKAITCYQKAISIIPAFAEAHSNLGNALQAQGKLDEAVVSYQKAITTNPDFVEAYTNLGVVLKRQGKSKESFTSFRKAVQIHPGFPEALSKLGDSLTKNALSDEVIIPYSMISNANQESTKAAYSPEFAPHSSNRSLSTNSSYCHEAVIQEFAKKRSGDSGDDNLRIVLFQPPIWKIQSPGAPPFPSSEGGHPTKIRDYIDGDSVVTTYGLLSIAAQMLKSERKVLVCNISNFTWHNVEKLIRHIDADLIGITCMTYNLRGVCALTALIKKVHPNSHIVVGGSHPTALPAETLQHYPAIDTVVTGEGEATFLEIVQHLESNKPIQNIAGTAWRDADNQVHFGPVRERIENLDELTSPHDYFAMQILITSRGCPFRCTFCGSESQWGSKLKMNSEEYILQELENMVIKKGIKFLMIKDDTFTAVRRKTLSLCHKILERNLNFVWSCDTGQQPIETSSRFINAQLVAVDLSLSSLAYAIRKTRELELTNIDYIHGDIFDLAKIRKKFDIIECRGVLHHLADPLSGWKILVDLLRPNGVMKIGLYSKIARSGIRKIRDMIEKRGYNPTPHGIRECRQYIMSRPSDEDKEIYDAIYSQDFYSISECRDLIFHAQESQFTLLEINSALNDLGLKFLGFDVLDTSVISKFSALNPEKSSIISLPKWHEFEEKNPKTFAQLYEFWVQKI